MRAAVVLVFGLMASAPVTLVTARAQGPQPLQSPAAFEGIADPARRSRALFTEIGKVLTHPRCMNCHPAGDQPLQTAEHKSHWPPVPLDGCSTCHTESNVTLHSAVSYQSIPGHPRWQLAPHTMAWQGKSLAEICEQLKDKNRNGGRDLALLQEHVAKDDLVAWGWHPGEGREPAPGTQEIAGRLMQAWIDSGAHCP